MPPKINKMSFAHLRQSDHGLLERIFQSQQQRNDALTELIAYLSMWHPGKWIDDEKLYLLGRDIDLVCPPDFRNVVASEVQQRVSDRVAKSFISGFNGRTASANKVKTPPAIIQLEKLAARLERGATSEDQADIENIIGRYLAFTEGGGNPGPLIRGLSRIGGILVNVHGPMRPWAANLTRLLVQKGLKWATDSDQLWGLWGRSLLNMGAFEASEFVYWESLRRFPWNMHVRARLIHVLRRQKDKRSDALSFAAESFQMFPDSGPIAVQFAILLAQSESASDIEKAIDILSKRLMTVEKLGYETSVLSSILAGAAAKNLLTDQQLTMIVQRLRRKPKLLGGISHRLLNDHKEFSLAQRLWSGRIADRRDDHIAWSQWAKAFAASGLKADIDQAVQILRQAMETFNENPAIRNHLAKLLVSTGAPDNRKEAMELLRETMTSSPKDIYAPVQLAEALVLSGDPVERREAIILLEEAMLMEPGNQYARELSEHILKTPEGTPVSMEMPQEGSTELGKDEEFAEISEARIDPEVLIPSDVIKLGVIRRLRFVIKNGSERNKKAALDEVRELVRDAPFAYAKLLAIRQGIWSEKLQSEPSFAFAFEHALRENDEQLLESLSERFPRLAALTIVAKATLGDPASAAKIGNLMSTEEAELHPAARALRRRMMPHLTMIDGGASPEEVVKKNTHDIREALYDANEAALFEPALAA